MSAPTHWLASLDFGDAIILAIVPNDHMDRLSSEDRERLSSLLAQEHAYHQHAGRPAAEWNAAQIRAEFQRLVGEEGPGRDHR